MYVPVTDPQLSQLYVRALKLLETAPDRGAEGEVAIFRHLDGAGRPTYVVNQFSGSGGWASPSTYSLAAANLAAELLTLANGSVLIPCRQCDQDANAEGLA